MQRRKYSAEEKMELILLCLRNPGRESATCRERGINPSLYARWKKQFIESGREGLRYGSSAALPIELEAENLKGMLAQLYVENQLSGRAYAKGCRGICSGLLF